MFLIDDLIMAPGKAVFFLFQSLAKKAQEEWLDETPIRQELQELYMLLEAGTISEREFEARECRLVERLEQIARFKSQAAGIAEEQGIDAGANHGIQ
ncbi:MAG: gas vesicle protein GvpG [Acidobacteria bacterium]|nr:MAG: gas vesicle protein GvpG [Acidobacteriota bacterium]